MCRYIYESSFHPRRRPISTGSATIGLHTPRRLILICIHLPILGGGVFAPSLRPAMWRPTARRLTGVQGLTTVGGGGGWGHPQQRTHGRVMETRGTFATPVNCNYGLAPRRASRRCVARVLCRFPDALVSPQLRLPTGTIGSRRVGPC